MRFPVFCFASLTLFAAATFHVTVMAQEQTEQQSDNTGELAEAVVLVGKLGDPDFRTREEASQRLVELGHAVVTAIEEGTRNPDPEIRLRCERIAAVIDYKERWRLVEEFEKDVDGKKGTTLPGWDRFKSQVEDSPAARSLYVRMFKAEDELIALAETKPQEAATLFAERAIMLQKSLLVFRQQHNSNVTTAALLFVANKPEVNIPDNIGSQLYSFCSQANFANQLTGGTEKELYRKLLGIWVANGEGNLAYQRLLLALRFNIPEGVDNARTMLKKGNAVPQHYRQYAVLAVAKMGNEEDIEIVTPVLTDTTRVSTRVINRQRFEVQLRDVALACVIHLAGEDPKAFGFDDVQMNEQYLFNASTLGFENEEKRKDAFAKWDEYVDDQAPPPPAP